MRFGAMNFPVKPVLEEIEVFAGLGLDYLELALDAPMGHHLMVLEQKERIKKALARHRMGLVCHMPTFVYLADLTEGIRRASFSEVAQSLSTAAALGASKVVLHPPTISGLGAFLPDTAYALSLDSLERLIDQAAGLDLPLCLENMFPRCRAFYRPEDFDDIFKRYPGVQLTLDIGHAHISSAGSSVVMEFIHRWGSRIGHLHASDNHGVHDEHLPLGKGTVAWGTVAAALRDAGFDNTITLEIFTDRRQDLADGCKFLQRLFAAK